MNREELLIKYKDPIKIGQDGFIQLIDVMGDDTAICQAARTSYGVGTKTVQQDRELIRYLVRNRHTSPLEMCEIKLCIQAPIYVLRQWLRHRTASVNEYSLRYSESLDLYEHTPENAWRSQSKDNKQGSGELISLVDRTKLTSKERDQLPYDGYNFSDWEEMRLEEVQATYKDLLINNVAREQARKILPLSTYSRCYWKIDLHNLLHFLKLRMSSHAQPEIREFGYAIWGIVQDWVPETAAAFDDYGLESINLSQIEWKALNWISKHFDITEFVDYSNEEIKDILDTCFPSTSKSERKEFVSKVKTIFSKE